MSNTASWQFKRAFPAKANNAKQIAKVAQHGSFAHICNTKGPQLFVVGAGDGIVGFPKSSVNIRRGNFIYAFDSKSSQRSVTPTGN